MHFLRKHSIALAAIAAWHFVFFFPTLFMQRVVSPNDIFFNFAPWGDGRTAVAQNAVINDPPTSYLTMLSLVKGEPRAFHWDPFVACGIPGWGSSSAASLTPFTFLPTILLPLSWVYTGIIFLKLNVAFFFAYLWLREERLGKRGAAIGAILFAASGVFAVRWLWQATNATPLYPALLWIAVRTARGKRTPAWAVLLIALAYALSGFPAAMAYGAWVALVYFVFRGGQALLPVPGRRWTGKSACPPLIAVLLALGIATPMLVSFAQLVRRTGYLAVRASAAAEYKFPWHHAKLFLRPDALGNRAYHNWAGDAALGILNNYIEATVYVGLIAIPLVALALANRRARWRWFWLCALLVILGAMFGVAPFIGALPGFKFSPLTRLQIILPIPVAYLAAAGAALISRRALVAATIAILAAADLAVFAGRFYPYLEPARSMPPTTPTIAFLQRQPRPFRIAPFFDYFWPNAAELYRLEDIRSHFSSEARYRRMLERIDPTSFSNGSTVIEFNGLKFDLTDPLVSMLGVRYFVEQPSIDIVKWSIFAATKPGVTEIGSYTLMPNTVAQRHVHVDAEPFWSIELPIGIDATTAPNPSLRVLLIKNERVMWSRTFVPADWGSVGKLYVPLRPYARLGETVVLRIESRGIRGGMLKAAAEPGDTPFFYGRVTTPVIFDRELPEGRLFRNLAEVPRFHAVSRVRKMDDAAFLAAKDVDFAAEAIVTDASAPLPETSDAAVTLRSYADDEQAVDVSAPARTLLASSEKLTPELGVTIDGRAVKPVEINMLFAGVPVPPGEHRVVFARRVGRGWWPLSGACAVLAVALIIVDLRRRI
ncbi:MAG TPA: hypothetical protein VG323_17610 [Thermoanaerobaculia bacterium]|nr:hypothetical protein [Thermoanaerobaculia bacterium]